MYYEEKLINGVLHFRSIPGGPWHISEEPYVAATNALALLGPEDRLSAMRFFCEHCGDMQADGRMCQCWNDE